MKSRFDGMGLHHIWIGHILVCGGFPDFGRSMKGMPVQSLDKKGRKRLKYVIYDMSLVKSGGGKFMSEEETARAEAGYCVLLRNDGEDGRPITGLIDIVIKKEHRGRGIGSEVVRALADAVRPAEFDIYDVKRGAAGFWSKMGAVPVDSKKKDWVFPAG